MKTLHLSIIVIISVVAYSTGIAYGELVPKTLTELYQEYQGKLIITGQVISTSEIPQKNLTSYDIKILDYITRPQQASIITAVSPTENKTTPIFNVDDRVQLYLDRDSSGYMISPYSFKMSKGCSNFGPSYVADFGPSHGSPASEPVRFLDPEGNVIIPTVNQQNRLSYDVFNYSPLDKTTIDLKILLNDGPNPVFHDTKYLDLKPCTGKTLAWNFVPMQMGNYTITLRQSWGIYDNKIILGNYTLVNYGFSPSPTTKTGPLSPLKQFKSGTDFDDISCKEGFALVAKAENNHPSCIKVTNISKLVSRGWASNSVNKLVIHGLRNVYQTHEKIDATIIFHGLTNGSSGSINGCDFPDVAVLDSNQNIVWKIKGIFSSCIRIPPPIPPSPSYVNQKIDLNSGLGEPLIINQTGNYKLTVSYYNMTSEREFNIVSYLR